MRARRWIGPALAVAALAAVPARAQGCPAGTDDACYHQALDLAERALGADQRERALLQQALALFEGACGRGIGDACYFAGRLEVALRGRRAVDLFQAGCHASRPSAAACNALGFAAVYSRDAAPPDSALHHLLEGCGHGSATACGRAAAKLDDWPAPAARAATLPAALERTACQGGSPVGCMRLAERMRAVRSATPRSRGSGDTPGEVARADSVVRAACHAGLPPACTAVGDAYAAGGLGLRRQLDSAAHYYEHACSVPTIQRGRRSGVGDGLGCARRGHLLLRGAGTSRDSAEALDAFTDGCLLLDSDACADLALLSHRRGMADESTVMRAVTACLEGSGYGCWVAAELYGDGIRPDPRREVAYLERACRQGYGAGCADLGNIAQGEGRLQDAFKQLRRACDLRSPEGCLLYGSLVTEQVGPEHEEAWLARACEYGLASACWDLSQLSAARGREVEAGVYRSRACGLNASNCKRKH
jgi:TPR repeat protein